MAKLSPLSVVLMMNAMRRAALAGVWLAVEFSILWPIISPICHSTRPVNRTVSP
jgi:hypothetical protein